MAPDTTRKRVLAVDDEPVILRVMEVNLRASGYEPVTASDARTALERFRDSSPDLILLDIMLPDRSGFEVLSEIRMTSDVPVIVVTAKGDSKDAVRGLELGADDYVAKPFDIEELLARVSAVFRRLEPKSAGGLPDIYDDGWLHVNRLRRLVEAQGREVDLTPIEYEVLLYLVSRTGEVLPHDEVLARVWGPEYKGESHYLRVVVARLRSKLSLGDKQARPGARIVTVPRVGYRYEAPAVKMKGETPDA